MMRVIPGPGGRNIVATSEGDGGWTLNYEDGVGPLADRGFIQHRIIGAGELLDILSELPRDDAPPGLPMPMALLLGLAAKLLETASYRYSRDVCTDWEPPEHWTPEQVAAFGEAAWRANGQDECDDTHRVEDNYTAMWFLSVLFKHLAESTAAEPTLPPPEGGSYIARCPECGGMIMAITTDPKGVDSVATAIAGGLVIDRTVANLAALPSGHTPECEFISRRSPATGLVAVLPDGQEWHREELAYEVETWLGFASDGDALVLVARVP